MSTRHSNTDIALCTEPLSGKEVKSIYLLFHCPSKDQACKIGRYQNQDGKDEQAFVQSVPSGFSV